MGPSKSATKIEREWMAAIADFGCVACHLDGNQRPAAVHHIISGNRRMGHLFTIPLCDPGHHKDGHTVGMISVHDRKRSFVARYGTELELMAMLKVELGYFDEYTT
jgi:hypothetical protein